MYRVGSFEFSPACVEKCPIVHRGVCAAIARIALNERIDASFPADPGIELVAKAIRRSFEPDGDYENASRCDGPKVISEIAGVWQCGRERSTPGDSEEG